MRKAELVISALLLFLLVAACAPAGAPALKVPAAPAKSAWEAEWEKVLAAAKQEGKVHVATTGGAEGARAMTDGMKNAYGIDAEVIVTRGGVETPKMQAERKAGLYLRDIWMGGPAEPITQWKPSGMHDPLEPQFIQPHLTDPEVIKKVWYEGKLWWADKEHFVLISTLQPRPTIAINTNLVKEGELKSYRDLLNPKWKGRIIQDDPTVPGGGQNIWGTIWAIMGEDFCRELAKMEQVLSRDERQTLDWLALGKMAIAIAPDGETIPVYEKAGAPIKVLVLVEGVQASAASSGLALFNNPAHPNAAKVFINWITSKEGQGLYSQASANHSLRLDVSTDYLRPDQMRQPGAKYSHAWTEEWYEKRQVPTKLAKELFAPKK